jgi:beta-galactosidase
MKLAFNRHKKDTWVPWPIGDDRPLFLGESFFANGFPPAAYSAVMGEQAFLGRSAADKGVHQFARMLAEGYRWHGIAGFHFWFNGDSADNQHYKAFQPVAVFCRQWNWTFDGGQEIQRTLKVFNDTRFAGPIDVEWSFRIAGKTMATGAKTFALEPGTAKEFSISFKTPETAVRTNGELILTCKRGGKLLFHDVKPLVILPPLRHPAQLSANDIVVYDPKGISQPWLKERGYPFNEVKSLDKLPARIKVLVIGPDALTPLQATDARWVALAATGARVLVLDQAHPLHYQAVPADLTTTEHVGRIAFPENLEHPVFAGLGAEDFFCWSGDHIVYRNVYKKASRGARSLLQCDDELSCSALCECPVKDGVLVLAQIAIGSKLERDPLARRLLDNLIRYCLDYRLPAKATVSVFPDGDLRLKLLDAIGLKHGRAANILQALSDSKTDIVVADASPANLAKLAGAKEEFHKFTDRGGYLMLWGLTPEGLADYNKVVGINHVLRPFQMERVTLPGRRDPLLAGITARDVVLEGTEQIYPWAGDRYPGKDTFTYVVDLEDIAPFAKSSKYAYGWSQMTNGLTSADSWKFIFYHELKNDPRPKWSVEFPHPEEILSFSIILNTHYQVISKLRLIFDDNEADAVTLDLKRVAELKQEFTLKPRRCKSITLEPVAFDTRGKQPTTGVDNIWIKVRRGQEYHERVVPLLNIGALVKYRLGKGGVILNQLRTLENEPNPVNGPKKQNIVASLLRNLGATFTAEKLLIAGANLKYVPIPLNEKCNQFLTADKGWIAGQPDLGHLSLGEQKLAGVDYLIRDFKTSPLPACIMLAGPGAKGNMPRSVKDIPVGQNADALFFLHTFHRTKEWKPPHDDKKKDPPALFQYVIHFADGKSAIVPVRYDRAAGHWLTEQPQGLPDAVAAWVAPLPKEPKRHAIIFQMAWTNPRPDVAIRSIDVLSGDGYGVPVVLAITAGTAQK